MESSLQSIWQCRVFDHRRGDTCRHAAGFDRERQGQGAYRSDHCVDHRQSHCDYRIHNAGRHVGPRLLARRSGRVLPDRLDRTERYLSLPNYGHNRKVRTPETRRRRRNRGPPLAALADRILFRRVLRGRFGIWYTGRDHGLGSDRPRIFSVGCFGTVADRQYRPCCLWCPRYADPGPCLCHGTRSLYSGCNGRTAIAGILADRAVLGCMGVRRLERHEGRLAGDPCHRRVVRDSAIRDLQLHQPLDRRYRRIADLDGLPYPVPESLAAEGALAVAGIARQG